MSEIDIGVSSVAESLEVDRQIKVIVEGSVVLVDEAQHVQLGESHWDVADHDRREVFLVAQHRVEVDLVALGRRDVGTESDAAQARLTFAVVLG